MAEATDKEPSIEEILESIRQIISDDDTEEEATEAVEAAAEPEPAPAAPPAAEPPAEEDEPVLELTDKVETPEDIMPVEEIDHSEDDKLLSDTAANASADAMSKLLSGNVAVENYEIGRPGPVTLEEMARDLMRPLLKSWLDQNLPGIIEKMVAKEIERISRKAGN